MGAMTIRGLDEVTLNALKEKAKQEGTSINAALVKILRKELGIDKNGEEKVAFTIHDSRPLTHSRSFSLTSLQA